jgi:hypothetical protein
MIATGTRATALERVCVASLAAHLLALAALFGLLLPGTPARAGLAERAAWLAAHPWLWRLGWLPWLLAALCDLALAAALVASPRLGRWSARAAFAVAVGTAAVTFPGQLRYALALPGGALRALATGDLTTFSILEARDVRWAFGLAPLLAAAAGLAWSAALRRAYWSTACTRAALAAFPTLALAGAAALVWAWSGFPFWVATGFLAAGLALATLWLVLVAEQVFTQAAPYAALPSGAGAPWFPPARSGALGAIATVLANSRLVKRAAERITARVGPPAVRGELHDAVFLASVVPVAEVRPLVPAHLAPAGLGAEGARTLLVHAVFRHHHVGPRIAGPLRRLWPRRLQSVLAVPVRHQAEPGATPLEGVYLVSGATSSTVLALAARILYEGVPLHRAAAMTLEVGEHRVEARVEPGGGSAPDLQAVLRARLGTRPPLPAPAAELFPDWDALISHVAAPARLLSSQPHLGRVTVTELSLAPAPRECIVLEVESLSSAYAAAVAGEGRPVCFLAPRIELSVWAQRSVPLGPAPDLPWGLPPAAGAGGERRDHLPGAADAGASGAAVAGVAGPG